ncbi:MAG: hypothetical protein JNK46_08720 [Methylobacteriaceae bacterium]|nr:hypothetical protein [Methylobacteriaceae bacterium]
MAVTISAPVGYKSANRPDDVRKVHDLLKRVAPAQGGPPASFNPAVPYSPAVTDQHIYNFQVKQFGKGSNADAVVDPARETLKRLNALAGAPGGGIGINPPPGPPAGSLPPTAPDPGKPGVGEPARAPSGAFYVGAVLLSNTVNHAYIAGYQNKPRKVKAGVFKVPTYGLLLGHYRDWEAGLLPDDDLAQFEVIRFGVKFDESKNVPGATDDDMFDVVGTCVGDFTLSRAPYLDGSWRIKGEYYIHIGPGNPRFRSDVPRELSGALGCVEVCNRKWIDFQVRVRALALGLPYLKGEIDDAAADRRITEEGLFRLLVQPAARPPLVRVK